MAWQTPKTNWAAGNIPAASDFNRIEGNEDYLKQDLDNHKNTTQTHGVSSGYYIAKTSRSDQLPDWNDIQNKPSEYPQASNADKLDGYHADTQLPAVAGNIPDNSDLSDYKTPGFYYCSSNASAGTITNAPEAHAFALIVLRGAYVLQVAVIYDSSAIYVRAYYSWNDTWTNWTKFWSAGNDGANSGLDADKVDGHHVFVQSDEPTASAVGDLWIQI